MIPAWKNIPKVPPVMTKTPPWNARQSLIAYRDLRRNARAMASSQRMTVQDNTAGRRSAGN